MNTNLRIEPLDAHDGTALAQATAVLAQAFNDPQRYGPERLRGELLPAPMPFYRRFFVAYQGAELVGAGGVKAADWASDTHVLFLSAVAPHARGQGVARALVQARLAWVSEHFACGTVLVSTRHRKRFAALGFRPFTEPEDHGRTLMALRWSAPAPR